MKFVVEIKDVTSKQVIKSLQCATRTEVKATIKGIEINLNPAHTVSWRRLPDMENVKLSATEVDLPEVAEKANELITAQKRRQEADAEFREVAGVIRDRVHAALNGFEIVTIEGLHRYQYQNVDRAFVSQSGRVVVILQATEYNKSGKLKHSGGRRDFHVYLDGTVLAFCGWQGELHSNVPYKFVNRLNGDLVDE